MALYEIYTAQDLRRFRDIVNDGNNNLNAILMNDIDLQGNDLDQWEPIAINWSAPFSGTFDGNGHTISGLYINRSTILDEYGEPDYDIDELAFISISSAGAVIKNLILEGYILGGWYGVAGFVANLQGKIINCINRVVLTCPEWGYAIGGLAAVAYDAEIINCINEADIGRNDLYSASMGGIVCYYNNGYIINCINKGNIYGEDSAGIACEIADVTINNCVNEGNIFASEYSCGIARNYWTSAHNIITNCVNKGIITGDEYISGIVDHVTPDLELKNCVNEGIINCESKYGSIFITLYDADYTQNNYYLDTSCNQAGVYDNDSVIISIPDSITPYTEGNAPTVSALVDTMYVEANSLRVKLYPYYNPSISTVTFSDWGISNSRIAEVNDDDIIELKRSGTFYLDYNTSFVLNSDNKSLGTVNIVDKLIKVVIDLPSKYLIKHLKQYNNYLFCLFSENK